MRPCLTSSVRQVAPPNGGDAAGGVSVCNTSTNNNDSNDHSNNNKYYAIHNNSNNSSNNNNDDNNSSNVHRWRSGRSGGEGGCTWQRSEGGMIRLETVIELKFLREREIDR